LKAAALAVVTGIAWQIDPTDPYRSLVTIAIDRAEAKAPRAPNPEREADEDRIRYVDKDEQ
jgi:hypothetical protein